MARRRRCASPLSTTGAQRCCGPPAQLTRLRSDPVWNTSACDGLAQDSDGRLLLGSGADDSGGVGVALCGVERGWVPITELSCRFSATREGDGMSVDSEVLTSGGAVACAVPQWPGSAQHALVELLVGETPVTVLGPSAVYSFGASWFLHPASPTSVSVLGGGVLLWRLEPGRPTGHEESRPSPAPHSPRFFLHQSVVILVRRRGLPPLDKHNIMW